MKAMQQSTLNPYVFFSGRCEEALQYYQQHLGATVDLLMRFSDNPEPMPEGALPEGFENKIMHAEFTVGDVRIFTTDHGESGATPSGFSLALTVPEADDAHRVFNALADGGNVTMPLSKTFWSPLYGQVTDKFGIAWMVMLPEANN